MSRVSFLGVVRSFEFQTFCVTNHEIQTDPLLFWDASELGMR